MVVWNSLWSSGIFFLNLVSLDQEKPGNPDFKDTITSVRFKDKKSNISKIKRDIWSHCSLLTMDKFDTLQFSV
jgi:hypothetical protein